MNQKHVPSLELCEELDRLCKEKGIVVPATEFYWYLSPEGWVIVDRQYKETSTGRLICPPAPLVSELGEWLPTTLELTTPPQPFPKTEQTILMFSRYLSDKNWEAVYVGVKSENVYIERQGQTEANARQMMLNFLIAEGIITTL